VERRTRDNPIAGFNLVAVVEGQGLCLHYDGTLRRAPIGPGVHVVSSDRDLDDPAMPEKQCLDRFVAAHPGVPDLDALQAFLSSHEGARPICKHGDGYGTVSSTIVVDDGQNSWMWYAAGPPCTTPYREVTG